MITTTFQDQPFLAIRQASLCAVNLITYTGGGDTFDCYLAAQPIMGTLAHGVGYDGPWVMGPNYTGIGPSSSGSDTFETYPDGYGVWFGGQGWVGEWITSTSYHAPSYGTDTFESYSDGTIHGRTSYAPSLSYGSLTNWDVTAGTIDLVGSNFDDIFPNNGLYLRLPTSSVPRSAIALKSGSVHLSSGTYDVNLVLGALWDFNVSVVESPYPSINFSIGSSVEGVLSAGQFVLSSACAPDVITYPSQRVVFSQAADMTLVLQRGNAPANPTPYIISVDIIDTSTSDVVFSDRFDTENAMANSLPYGGYGWNGIWKINDNYLGNQAIETFDYYTSTEGCTGGSGWKTAWKFEDNATKLGLVTFDPTSGAPPVTVTLTPPVVGATIYYTTDGSTPTNASPVYTSPIDISVDTTIKALATKTGYFDSDVASSTYANVVAPGQIGWWKADALTLNDNDPVDTWPESISGVSNMTQSSAANKPVYKANQINGNPAVYFGGDSRYLTIPSIAGLTGTEIYIVLKLDADPPAVATCGLWFWGGNTSYDGNYSWPFNDTIYDQYMNTALRFFTKTPAVGNSLAVWHVYNVISVSGEWTAYLKGVQQFTTATNTFSTTGATKYLGRTPTYYLKGFVAEILLFDHKLSAGDRTAVATYISGKYGI